MGFLILVRCHIYIESGPWCCCNKGCCKTHFITQIVRIRLTIYPLSHWGRIKMVARFSDDIFKCIFLNENVSISIEISLKFVSTDPINNIPTLVQVMAWYRPGILSTLGLKLNHFNKRGHRYKKVILMQYICFLPTKNTHCGLVHM